MSPRRGTPNEFHGRRRKALEFAAVERGHIEVLREYDIHRSPVPLAQLVNVHEI